MWPELGGMAWIGWALAALFAVVCIAVFWWLMTRGPGR